MGGLSKKAYQFEEIAKSQNKPVLTLDGGNLLFKKEQLSPKLAEQEKATALGIVKSYNLMGYDAVGIARQDLIAGLGFLRKIADSSQFPWLSANLVDQETNKPLFNPYVIVNKGELQIAVFAMTSPQVSNTFAEKEMAVVLPWQEVMPDLVNSLKAKSDILIMLSNLTERENKELTNNYPDIDIIIQAGVNNRNIAPQLSNNTLIFQTAKQGKQIGILEINWHSSAWGSQKEDQLIKKKLALDRLLWQLGKYNKYKNPLEDLKANPRQLNAYKNLLSKKKDLSREIDALAQNITPLPEGQQPSTYKNRFIAMDTNLPDQPDVLAVVERLNEEINELGKIKTAKATSKESAFVGSDKCSSCHKQQYAIWQKSRHAGAYATLVEKKQQFNLNCLPCHITGDGDLDNQDAISLAINLQAVGCENCHGAGKQHIASPSQNKLTSTPSAKLCLSCHSEDHDDSFVYDRDVEKLKCTGTVK